eukprot:gb/GECG01005522.1/.p1 GENE.gb/GECG01005522.1/~~gb/GECG01005522.1/.p1  ORF type:complete len:587 (+),score=121.55 gb/GECG01005522.1/:1-1761(+)
MQHMMIVSERPGTHTKMQRKIRRLKKTILALEGAKKQKASKTLDPVQTLDKEIEQLQAENMRMRIAYDRKQKQNAELKRMVSVHITQGKKRAEWSYKHQDAKRSIRLRQNEITKAADILNKRLTANRELLQELNQIRQSRAHADSTYVSLAKEEASISRQCAQLETKLQQMHIEHRKLSNRIHWMNNKAAHLEAEVEDQRKDNAEVIREERRQMEAEARRQTEAATDDDEEASVVSSEPSVEGQQKRPQSGGSLRSRSNTQQQRPVASAQSGRSDKGDGKTISRREYLLTEAEELVAEINDKKEKVGVVDGLVDAAMEEYQSSGDHSIPQTESQRLHVTGQMIMRTELRMENIMQEIQDMLQRYTEIQHRVRDHNKKKPRQESAIPIEDDDNAEHEGEEQQKSAVSAQASASDPLSLQTRNREDDLSAHAVEEQLRTAREQIKQVEKQEQVLQTTLHTLFGHPLFEVASEALNPHSGMAAFTGGVVLSRHSYHEDKNEPQPNSATNHSHQEEPQQSDDNAEKEEQAGAEESAALEDTVGTHEESDRQDSTTVVKSVQDLQERLRALEKTVRQIQAAEHLIGMDDGE